MPLAIAHQIVDGSLFDEIHWLLVMSHHVGSVLCIAFHARVLSHAVCLGVLLPLTSKISLWGPLYSRPGGALQYGARPDTAPAPLPSLPTLPSLPPHPPAKYSWQMAGDADADGPICMDCE